MRKPDELMPSAQPDEPFYTTAQLSLVEFAGNGGWTRALYTERTGQQPPPWDAERRIKRWADGSVAHLPAQQLVSYNVLRRNDAGQLRPASLQMTAGEAASFNLPGTYAYPKYVIQPTTAEVIGPNGYHAPLDPAYLCTRAEADQFAADVDAINVIESTPLGPYSHNFPDAEPRRPWVCFRAGVELQCAVFIAARNERGIGSPGAWDLTGSTPIWVTTVPKSGPVDTRPEIELPVRLPLPNEDPRCTPFGCLIYRTDKEAGGSNSVTVEWLQRLDASLETITRSLNYIMTILEKPESQNNERIAAYGRLNQENGAPPAPAGQELSEAADNDGKAAQEPPATEA